MAEGCDEGARVLGARVVLIWARAGSQRRPPRLDARWHRQPGPCEQRATQGGETSHERLVGGGSRSAPFLSSPRAVPVGPPTQRGRWRRWAHSSRARLGGLFFLPYSRPHSWAGLTAASEGGGRDWIGVWVGGGVVSPPGGLDF